MAGNTKKVPMKGGYGKGKKKCQNEFYATGDGNHRLCCPRLAQR